MVGKRPTVNFKLPPLLCDARIFFFLSGQETVGGCGWKKQTKKKQPTLTTCICHLGRCSELCDLSCAFETTGNREGGKVWEINATYFDCTLKHAFKEREKKMVKISTRLSFKIIKYRVSHVHARPLKLRHETGVGEFLELIDGVCLCCHSRHAYFLLRWHESTIKDIAAGEESYWRTTALPGRASRCVCWAPVGMYVSFSNPVDLFHICKGETKLDMWVENESH